MSGDHIDSLRGAVFNIKSWLAQAGFTTSPRPRPHRLGTTDLVGTDLAVRVQYDRPAVDRVELHLLRLDNPRAESLAFFSDVEFTDEALASDELEVALFNYDRRGLLTPRNTKAFELIVAVADGPSPVSSRPPREPATAAVPVEDDCGRNVEPNIAALCLIVTVLAALAIGPWHLVRLNNVVAVVIGWTLFAGFAVLGFCAGTAILGGVREIAASRPRRTVYRQALTALTISAAFGVAGYLLTRLGHGVLSSTAWVLFIPNSAVLLLTAMALFAPRKAARSRHARVDAPSDAPAPHSVTPPHRRAPQEPASAPEENRVIDLTAFERKAHSAVTRRRASGVDGPAGRA